MIKDLREIPLVVREDDRGYLIEIARLFPDPEPHGVIHKFGQVYLVESRRGVIRAFHKHEKVWDFFFICQGAAKFIFKDDRPESPTYRKEVVLIASSRNPKLIVVPPGVWHGWLALEDNTLLISIASEKYNRERPDEERITPKAFGSWEIEAR
ncbi:MAG TPA: hypothetical protein EYP29_02580 [Thermoplasmata archaeon]|nr:hypothetical protein [Thermoplasmata archaeon]